MRFQSSNDEEKGNRKKIYFAIIIHVCQWRKAVFSMLSIWPLHFQPAPRPYICRPVKDFCFSEWVFLFAGAEQIQLQPWEKRPLVMPLTKKTEYELDCGVTEGIDRVGWPGFIKARQGVIDMWTDSV
jgi:hypothetical protein